MRRHSQEPRVDREPGIQRLLTIFPNADRTTAIIDRVIHQARIIPIKGVRATYELVQREGWRNGVVREVPELGADRREQARDMVPGSGYHGSEHVPSMSPPIIETAYDLYQAMSRQHLNLRSGSGRDYGLLTDLCAAVGCPDDQLAAFLNRTKLPAGVLLTAIIDAAAPFAKMFQEIWDYLASAEAVRASEEIRVRIDPDDPPMSLDQFREFGEKTRTILRRRTTETWPLGRLFRLAEEAGASTLRQKRDWPHYRSGNMYQHLPLESPVPRDDYERIVHRVHSLFQAIIDAAAAAMASRTSRRWLPEQRAAIDEPVANNDAHLVADLLPRWIPIFDGLDETPPDRRRAMVESFQRDLEPSIHTQRTIIAEEARDLLDILRLPFWKHRWQIYEIWIAVRVLEALAEYLPTPQIKNGIIDFTAAKAAILARLATRSHRSACVVAQLRTNDSRSSRTGIQPDLSVCFDDKLRRTSRAFIVEAKQRETLTAEHVMKVGKGYSVGSPKAKGVIIVNYDASIPSCTLPSDLKLFGNVQAQHAHQLDAFRDTIVRLARDAGLVPFSGCRAVLLDVSESMSGLYDKAVAQRAIDKLFNARLIKIGRFNQRLESGGDIETVKREPIRHGGGTDLAAAFAEFVARFGPIERLLVVSDGEYRPVPALKSAVPRRLRVMPHDLARGLEWIHSNEAKAPHDALDPADGSR